ncbi:MAG: hypothetical protein ACXABC_01215 [Candidatus Thorarchaeota archaeon]
MNRRSILTYISVLFVTLMLSTGLCPLQVYAATVWTDDFDDGDYDRWVITGINGSSPSPTFIDGNFTIENGRLKAEGPEWNHAYHDSFVASGTWSFDILAVDSELKRFYVMFITLQGDLDEGYPNGYSFMVATNSYGPTQFTAFALLRQDTGYDNAPLCEYETSVGVAGGYHIDITRNLDGEFNIWINGTHRITGKDTSYTISEGFRFHTPAGSSIDNVAVSDSVDFEAPTTSDTPTEPTPLPVDLITILILGVGIVATIVIIAIVMKKLY